MLTYAEVQLAFGQGPVLTANAFPGRLARLYSAFAVLLEQAA